jgi:methylenetetrahydrofolate dehydrogenase (NADP+)/methenyltetrahydrofolate cyclohydrolase
VARLLDGKAVAKEVHREVQRGVETFREAVGRAPGLRVVLVGEDPASRIYVRKKRELAARLGMDSEVLTFPADTSESLLLETIDRLNEAREVDGILVQLPLPDHLSTQKVIQRIAPEKDVDGFHPLNLGRLFSGLPAFAPCTPLGILRMFRHYEIPLEGKRVVVMGRSLIVGRPMGVMLLHEHATVTWVHSRTRDARDITRGADVLVVAVGKREMVDGSWIKEGAVVVDVGIHRTEEGRLTGDVLRSSVEEKASWVTPVPGGVGPMTVAMLMWNTLAAARFREGLSDRMGSYPLV